MACFSLQGKRFFTITTGEGSPCPPPQEGLRNVNMAARCRPGPFPYIGRDILAICVRLVLNIFRLIEARLSVKPSQCSDS